ncbi:MAG: glycosyltransferase family 4 protein [Thermoleophilia bacterium]
MRIAIVSDYYYPQLGGITEQVHGQATALTRRGHQVTVITPKVMVTPSTVDGANLPGRDFDVVQVGTAWPAYGNGAETLVSIDPRIPLRLRQLLAPGRFDLVHIHNPFGVALPMLAALAARDTPTVGTLHSVVPSDYRPLRWARRPLHHVLSRLDARVTVSDAVVESIGPHFPDLEFRTIPNGIDTRFFTPDASPLPDLGDRRNIVFVGRFDPRNGVKTMIRAFTLLHPTHPDVRLVIVGDGPLRPMVERLVPAHLREHVTFAGRVNQLRPRYLASAAVLCTPCSLASFGMVLLEGMSAGLPVVASRISGFRLVMRDGVDGLMVDRADDERGFAAALARLLDDPALAAEMGAAGRSRAVETFGWPVVTDQLEALYSELVASKAPARRIRLLQAA